MLTNRYVGGTQTKISVGVDGDARGAAPSLDHQDTFATWICHSPCGAGSILRQRRMGLPTCVLLRRIRYITKDCVKTGTRAGCAGTMSGVYPAATLLDRPDGRRVRAARATSAAAKER